MASPIPDICPTCLGPGPPRVHTELRSFKLKEATIRMSFAFCVSVLVSYLRPFCSVVTVVTWQNIWSQYWESWAPMAPMLTSVQPVPMNTCQTLLDTGIPLWEYCRAIDTNSAPQCIWVLRIYFTFFSMPFWKKSLSTWEMFWFSVTTSAVSCHCLAGGATLRTHIFIPGKRSTSEVNFICWACSYKLTAWQISRR